MIPHCIVAPVLISDFVFQYSQCFELEIERIELCFQVEIKLELSVPILDIITFKYKESSKSSQVSDAKLVAVNYIFGEDQKRLSNCISLHWNLTSQFKYNTKLLFITQF